MKNKNISLILGLVFLVSFLFFSYTNDAEEISNSYEYVGLFEDVFNFNITEINGNDRHILEYNFIRDGIERVSLIPFRYSPMELEEIYMENLRDIILDSEVLYISRDPILGDLTGAKDAVAILTLARVLDTEMDPDIFTLPTGVGITYSTEGIFAPVVSCEYANLEARVVELRVGIEDKIYQEGDYCVVMEFQEGTDPIKVATKLTYHVLGIM